MFENPALRLFEDPIRTIEHPSTAIEREMSACTVNPSITVAKPVVSIDLKSGTKICSRPSPELMATLIANGLCEDDILALNRDEELKVDQTLNDVEDMLPVLDHLVEATVTNDDELLLFAARDAEVLYDLTRIAAGVGSLLPASTDLWNNTENSYEWQRYEHFLSCYGLGPDVVAESKPVALIDTGFWGSIGGRLRIALDLIYGQKSENVRINTKLVGKNEYARVAAIIANGPNGYYDIAESLQNLPRYHGAFAGIHCDDEGITSPIAYDQPVDSNIDDIRTRNSMNRSIVNPVAAALVQYRVVKHAMNT